MVLDAIQFCKPEGNPDFDLCSSPPPPQPWLDGGIQILTVIITYYHISVIHFPLFVRIQCPRIAFESGCGVENSC